MADKFPFWKQKYQEVPADLSGLLSVKEYAAKYSYTTAGVMALIQSDRATAYKMQSQWWLVDEPPL